MEMSIWGYYYRQMQSQRLGGPPNPPSKSSEKPENGSSLTNSVPESKTKPTISSCSNTNDLLLQIFSKARKYQIHGSDIGKDQCRKLLEEIVGQMEENKEKLQSQESEKTDDKKL